MVERGRYRPVTTMFAVNEPLSLRTGRGVGVRVVRRVAVRVVREVGVRARRGDAPSYYSDSA
jgi:hypothetical protein